MTVPSTPLREDYTGNGVQTLWSYGWYLANKAHIKVVKVAVSNGSETPLVVDVDYSVQGVGSDDPALRKIQITPALTNAFKLVFLSNLPAEQTMDLTTEESVPPDRVEDAVDYLTRLLKQYIEVQTRTVTLPPGASTGGAIITDYINELQALRDETQGYRDDADADATQTALDRIATGNDVIATHADVVLTHADVVLTHADAVATAADRVQTGLDKVATAADRVQTGLDKVATAADRVQTGLDKVATAADRVQTGLDRTAVANDKATVAADKTTTLGYKNAAEAAAASVLPRKVFDLINSGRYGRAASSIFIDCVMEVAPTVGTFARSTTGSRWNRAGYLEPSIAINTARHEYDMTTGKYRGILMEPGRTNQTIRSQEFGNAAWTVGSGSITSDTTVAPDGTTTADTMAASTTIYPAAGVGSCIVDNTSSIYAKRLTGTSILTLRQNRTGDGVNYIEANFDLGAGTVGAVTNAGNASGGFAEIQGPDARGFYRCIVGGISSSTAGTVTINPSNGAGGTLAIWGAQCEAGRGATSYIPTTTAAVARGADTWSLTLSTANFNPLEGSLIFVGDYDTTAISDVAFCSLDNGSQAETLTLSTNFSPFNLAAFNCIAGSVFQAQPTFANPGARSEFCVGGGFKVNDFNGSLNGSAPVTDVAGSVPAVTTLRMAAAYTASTVQMIGHVRQVLLMNKKLSNAELQEISNLLRVA